MKKKLNENGISLIARNTKNTIMLSKNVSSDVKVEAITTIILGK